jgi:hypothetical protein
VDPRRTSSACIADAARFEKETASQSISLFGIGFFRNPLLAFRANVSKINFSLIMFDVGFDSV